MFVLIVSVFLFLLLLLWRNLRGGFYVAGLSKKHILVTGCDSGFGRALASRLDKLGVPVFAACLTLRGAESLRRESSNMLQTVQLDVTRHISIVEAYKFVKTKLEEDTALWGLVNNAGIPGAGGPTEFNSRQDYERVFAVNVFGMVDVTNTFLPLLKKSRGRLVNTCSIGGIVAVPRNLPYTASKFAVYGWSEAVRRNKAKWGIKVATVLPGRFKTGVVVDTTRTYYARKAQWESLPPDVHEEYGEEYRDSRLNKETLNMGLKQYEASLDAVVNAYEHALFSKYPKSRYLCGTDAYMYYLIQCLPLADPIMDAVLSRWYSTSVIPKVLKV